MEPGIRRAVTALLGALGALGASSGCSERRPGDTCPLVTVHGAVDVDHGAATSQEAAELVRSDVPGGPGDRLEQGPSVSGDHSWYVMDGDTAVVGLRVTQDVAAGTWHPNGFWTCP